MQPSSSPNKPIFSKIYTRLSLGTPVYSYDGEYLGKLSDAEIRQGKLTQLHTDQGRQIPTAEILACADAILLKKKRPYPLGQPLTTEKRDSVVTKSLLRKSLAQGTLIQLTLSLPPFCVNWNSHESRFHRVLPREL